jgi:GTP 3',8-cyclase
VSGGASPGEAPPAAGARPLLVDGQGRRVRYLRLSLTERCNLACSYCSPHSREGREALRREDALRLVRAFAALGVERVRLTGGEPTLRPDLQVAQDQLSVTTWPPPRSGARSSR